MTDITTAAAALLILAGATAPAPVPRPVTPISIDCQLPNPPPLHCESGWDHDCKAWASTQNHLVVRWGGDHPQPVRHEPPPRHEERRPVMHRPPPHHHHHRHDPGLIE